MIEGASTEHEIGIESERRDPVSVIFQCMQEFTLKGCVRPRRSKGWRGCRSKNRKTFTPFGSQMRIVRSLEAVYRMPLPPIPPPPHRTTFTLAECPPSAYSNLLVALDQTRTLPSLEEDARRGAVGFLRKQRQVRRWFARYRNRSNSEAGGLSRSGYRKWFLRPKQMMVALRERKAVRIWVRPKFDQVTDQNRTSLRSLSW